MVLTNRRGIATKRPRLPRRQMPPRNDTIKWSLGCTAVCTVMFFNAQIIAALYGFYLAITLRCHCEEAFADVAISNGLWRKP